MINIPQHFNSIDYTIVSIIVFSTIISFFRGFLREAISLVVWVTGLLIALKFSGSFQESLTPWIHSFGLGYTVAFAAIFLSVFVVGIVVNACVHALVDKVGLSVTDRFLGIFFGAARGFFIVSVILIFVGAIGSPPRNTTLAHSSLAMKFEPMTVWLNRFLPEQMKNFSQWMDLKHDDTIDLRNR